MAFEGFQFGGLRNMFQQAQANRSNQVGPANTGVATPGIAQPPVAPIQAQATDAINKMAPQVAPIAAPAGPDPTVQRGNGCTNHTR